MKEFDVVVIGGGPAGRVIVHALHSKSSSMKVALIKDEEVNANLLGDKVKFPGVINANISSTFDLSYGSAGLSQEQAEAHSIEVISGHSEVLNRYPMIDGKSLIDCELLFDREDLRLIGGSFLRRDHCVATNVDFLSLAIQMQTTAQDLLKHQYATQPELAAKPSDNSIVFATQDALRVLNSKKIY